MQGADDVKGRGKVQEREEGWWRGKGSSGRSGGVGGWRVEDEDDG